MYRQVAVSLVRAFGPYDWVPFVPTGAAEGSPLGAGRRPALSQYGNFSRASRSRSTR